MEGLAYVDAAAPARDDVFNATVGQHYLGLVRRLTAVVGDRKVGARSGAGELPAGVPGLGSRRRRWRDLLGRRADPAPWVVREDRGLHEALSGLRREQSFCSVDAVLGPNESLQLVINVSQRSCEARQGD